MVGNPQRVETDVLGLARHAQDVGPALVTPAHSAVAVRQVKAHLKGAAVRSGAHVRPFVWVAVRGGPTWLASNSADAPICVE